ncbi:MAG: tRNA (adenosine(37)-N6)-dimethylallyltransferase MiaA [Acidimicrobiales bacterium]|nr:MAG: tRNA (adenosine(37)-N6)-dimethylallyltransferase MiaA [Acidimicrobiales bacterium]
MAVVGPTAAGKSALAVQLAQRVGGEVINADAMQLYRGMDIGTAKLSMHERAGVVHHLLDIWPVTQSANVAEYQQRTRAAIDALLAAGVTPIVVGGSGLYVRAALDAMEFPGTDPAIRRTYERELTAHGPYVLHRRLAQIDPAAALVILPSNGRRIVRALEVIELTGKPFPAKLRTPEPVYDTVYLGVDAVSAVLDERIDARVRRMWRTGLVDEVQSLIQQGLREGPTAGRALGYRQVLQLIDGELSEAEAIAATALRTRQFVRRQRSWFRRDTRINWLDGAREDLLEPAVQLVALGPIPTQPGQGGSVTQLRVVD